MGKVAASLSDITVVTSDNPRDEDPELIIDEIMTGIDTEREITREPDRTKAVRMALARAREGDVILIAGKGHEEYQIVGDQKLPFSDARIVEEFISAQR